MIQEYVGVLWEAFIELSDIVLLHSFMLFLRRTYYVLGPVLSFLLRFPKCLC